MPDKRALPLLLIPGFMLDASLWDDLAEYLPHRDLQRVSLLDGQTVAEIARHIGSAAPPRFVLVGFSLGGYVARSLVEQFPDKVAALVLIATSLRPDTASQRQAKQDAVNAIAQGTFRGLSLASIARSVHPARAQDKALIGRIRDMGVRLGQAAFSTQSLLDRRHIATASIQCPTLIIASAEDALRDIEEALELRDAIPGSALAILEDTGHMIPLEQPQALGELISRWLDTQGL